MPDSNRHSSLWVDLLGVSFEQGYLDAGGVSTRYLRCGDRSLPVLLFLHGTGGHAEAYIRNLAAHGEHFSVWAIDMIGNGKSASPGVDLEIPVYVEHVANVLEALGADTAILSGESLGGWVAAQFALDHPQRVERLVLNTPGGFTAFPEVMERIRTLSMAAVEDPSWERIRSRLEFLMHDKSHVTDDIVAVRQAIYSAPGMVEQMRRTLVLQDWDIRQRNMIPEADWRRLHAPTLVLWTSHDPTAGVEEGRRLSEIIPRSRFEVMQGCGHWPQWEDPETFNRIHLSFCLGQD